MKEIELNESERTGVHSMDSAGVVSKSVFWLIPVSPYHW